MAVLIASDLAKDMVGEPLLRSVSFKLERRERMTIAGRNGAGKTTLLRMLAGETSIDGGELVFAKGTRVMLHDQRPPRDRDRTLREYILSGCTEPLELELLLRRLEDSMAAGDEKAFGRYADAQARFDAAGGYAWRDRALSVVHGLGFVDADLDRTLATFSGGQLTRASLARVLAAQPDLLLLDEPTNHLDIESLEWLEQTLVGLDAAIVLIAHDRWFLETVGTSVLEIEAGRSRFFPGTWHMWRREQASRELALGRAIDKQKAEIERMERFIERFRAKATKAKQAQSRVKALDKIDRITRDPRDTKSMSFAFRKPERSGRVVFELEGGRLEVGDAPARVLLDDAELWLERGEHVSLVGANGIGKTTLIDALAGRRKLDGGRLTLGHNVQVGFLSQHADELEFGGARTVLEACQKQTGLTPNKARALLGAFLFSGQDAEKPLAGISGGERRRLSIAILTHSDANVLILDEPTNHLDIESREALEDALRGFPGSLLLVSHDRALLDAVGSRTIAVERGSLQSYLGGWQEYSRVREERKAAGEDPAARAFETPAARREARANGTNAVAPAAPPKANGKAPAKTNGKANGKAAAKAAKPGPQAPEGPSKNAVRDQKLLEKAAERADAALAALEDELADPAAWASKYESAKSTARHTAAKRAVEDAYTALEAHMEKTGA